MTANRAELNRRHFLAAVAGCGAAGLGCLNARCAPAEEEGGPSRVVMVERPSVLEELTGTEARKLIHDLLEPLGAVPGARLKKGDRIGIKLNCLAGRGLSPRPELVFALVDALEEAGHSPKDIIIFERTERELRKAGFEPGTERGPTIAGNDSRGAGFESEPLLFESIGSCFSRILTRRIDALINFGVLKDHDLAGISVGLKNLYGLIHNPNKYHDNHCSPYVAHVAAAPPVRSKLRLTICDGLTAQYQGGPALKKECTWKAGILLASTDPVAIDRVGAELIDAKRKAMGLKTLDESGNFPPYLEVAHRLGLGEHRLEKIQWIKVT